MKISILGCGNLGGTIAEALIEAAYQPRLFDLDRQRLEKFSPAMRSESAQAAVEGAEVVIVAVKPTNIQDTLGSVSKKSWAGRIVVSVAAGVSCATLAQSLADDSIVVRVMPNVCVGIGAGMTAVFSGDVAAASKVAGIFGLLGKVAIVGSEDEIDIATAVSASGPAFAAYLINIFREFAVDNGLTSPELFARQTFLGAAKMLENLTSDQLISLIKTPNGTTAAGLSSLEANNVKLSIREALKAAVERARELRQG